jgi:hypothetical protein
MLTMAPCSDAASACMMLADAHAALLAVAAHVERAHEHVAGARAAHLARLAGVRTPVLAPCVRNGHANEFCSNGTLLGPLHGRCSLHTVLKTNTVWWAHSVWVRIAWC